MDGDLGAVCKAISHGSLMGARGNSGVILSQILRGIASVVADADGFDAASGAAALAAAAKAAYEAVMRPGRGHDPHRRARGLRGGGGRPPTAGPTSWRCSTRPAPRAPTRSSARPRCCPVLKDAGRGRRRRHRLPAAARRAPARRRRPSGARSRSRSRARCSPSRCPVTPRAASTATSPTSATRSCTSSRPPTTPSRPSRTCGPASATRSWSSAATASGTATSTPTTSAPRSRPPSTSARPRKIRVTDLIEQVEEEKWVREAVERRRGGARPTCARRSRARSSAVATGGGHPAHLPLARRAGDRHRRAVDEPVHGRAASRRWSRCRPTTSSSCPTTRTSSRWPSRSTPTPTKTVHVVPTKGITEGFAALLAYDPEAESDANAAEMADAAENVVAGEVTQAVRDSSCDVGPIATGDWLGIARDGIRAVEAELGRGRHEAPRRAGAAEPRDRHHHRGRRCQRGGDPAHHRVARRAPPGRRRPRCTTAASRSTRTSSASSDPAPASADGQAPPRPRRGARHQADGGRPRAGQGARQDRGVVDPRPADALPAPLHRQDEAVVDPRRPHRRVDLGVRPGRARRPPCRGGAEARRAPSCAISDGSGHLRITFFNQPWRARQFPEGSEAMFFGKVTDYRGQKQLANPEVDLLDEEDRLQITAIYPQSDKLRLYSRDFRGWMARVAAPHRRPRGAAAPLGARPPRLRRPHRGVPRRPPPGVDARGRGGPPPAGVRRAAPHPARPRAPQADDRGHQPRHRARHLRVAGAAVPRRPALRAHRRPDQGDRRDHRRPGPSRPDAPPAPGRRGRRQDRRGRRRPAHRGRGRPPGRVHGADRGARRAALHEHAADARRHHRVRRRARRCSASGRSPSSCSRTGSPARSASACWPRWRPARSTCSSAPTR